MTCDLPRSSEIDTYLNAALDNFVIDSRCFLPKPKGCNGIAGIKKHGDVKLSVGHRAETKYRTVKPTAYRAKIC